MKLNNLLKYLVCENVEKEVSFEVATNEFFYDNLDENILDVISKHAIPVFKHLHKKGDWAVQNCDMATDIWRKVLKKAGIQYKLQRGYYISDPRTLDDVKRGKLSPPGSSDHVWLTIDGNIFDPTAGQFQGPIKLSHYIYE